ncbi:MAG: hypothetical protein EBX52_02145 [Proteobacteria bacterium]|nr:hypothetical protein [Pseudomonadota bacterium]
MRVNERKAHAPFRNSGPEFKRFGFMNRSVGVFLFLLASALASCTNIDTVTRSPSSVIQQVSPVGGPTGTAAFSLVGLVPDPTLGSSVYDLLGQNGEFDQFCSPAVSACDCVFSYDLPAVGKQVVQVANSHQETNMIRCPNVIPPGIQTFEVKLVTTAPGTVYESNSMIGSFGAGGNLQGAPGFVDIADELSYSQVQRYQCRRLDFIPSPFDGSFLDPIQSQDPRVIYPFNYYTTNVGESLLALQRNSTASGWECTLTPTLDNRMHWWANPMVFSVAPCTSAFCMGDGELMYPQNALESGRIPTTVLSTANGKRRSSFALLSKPYGVFNVPVIAATAPNTTVAAYYSMQAIDQNLTLGPLGYAARAIPSTSGNLTTSSCPAVTIPSNARWVKLWNFRADLKAPRRVAGTTASLNNPIGCWTESGSGIYDSCQNSQTNGTSNTGYGPLLKQLSNPNVTAETEFAARVALTSTSGGSGRDPSACYKPQTLNPDLMEPSWFAFNGGSVSEILSSLISKPWSLYSNVSSVVARTSPSWLYEVQNTSSATNPTTGTFKDIVSPGQSQPLSADNYTDQMFVVTDVGVSDSAMITANSSVDQYRPRTYRTKADCPGISVASCASSGFIEWGINSRNVDNANGPEVYPLCVLQFTD